MIIWGSKAKVQEMAGGVFFCPNCQADVPFKRQRIARYFTLYFIPLFPTATLGEYIRCGSCASEMRPEVLALSRADVMRLVEPWVCGQCGNKNASAEKVCLGCQAPRPVAPPPLPGAAGAAGMASRPVLTSEAPAAKRPNLALWIILGIVAVLVLPIFVIPLISIVAGKGAGHREEAAGKLELRHAETAITTNRHGTALGNSAAAIRLAAQMSNDLLSARTALFTGEDGKGLSATGGEFVVFCQLSENSCAFLVHVPDLRHYASDAAKAMADAAYLEAYKILDKAGSHPLRLAVATRGTMLYGSVRIGSYSADSSKRLESAQEVASDTATVPALLPFFAPKSAESAIETPEAK